KPRIETYTPFPIEEIDDLLERPRSTTPRWALAGGLIGLFTAAVGQWFITAYDYPLDAGDRPLNPLPAYVPVMFELTVLGVAIGSLLGLLWHCSLLRWWHPLFEQPGFERATRDRFFVLVDGVEAATVEAAVRASHGRLVSP